MGHARAVTDNQHLTIEHLHSEIVCWLVRSGDGIKTDGEAAYRGDHAGAGGGNMVDWFRRFSEIPGVTFARPAGVDPTSLPGYGVVPETRVYEFEGRRREALSWPAESGVGSASPAHARAFGNFRDAPAAEWLKHCYEGLELPGVPSDYHFIIQACAGALWSRRRREPQALEDVERLCWLDIQLIEARPETIEYEHEDEPMFYRVLTFAILIDLYEREGYLREALAVADTAARHGQGPEARDRLAQRIAVVENEDRASIR